MTNKALLASNADTIWKTKHSWIRISYRNGDIAAEYLIGTQKNENMPITVTVAPTLCFPLYQPFITHYNMFRLPRSAFNLSVPDTQ